MVLPKSFYVMRHAQSADNAVGLISGAGSDPHLTLKGYKQAEIASIVFNRLDPKPTLIVSSGLIRAHVTALTVTGYIDIIQDPDLNERHLGELDGKITEIRQKEMKILPGEEKAIEHGKRVMAAINRHLQSEETPLFVCHGGTIRRVMEELEPEGSKEIDNARIYKFMRHDNIWQVITY